MVRGVPQLLLILILAELASAFVFNNTLDELDNVLNKGIKTRRQGRKRHKSTSSSGNRKEKGSVASGNSAETLDLSSASSSTDSSDGHKKRKKKDRKPKSSAGRKGWRKWHRKCNQCPEDMRKKWRDPSIKWICGAYQQARRTFKSLCMMHYRNCQDGTMFTKILDHRCPNSSGEVHPHGDHFFYDYKVQITDESTADSDEKDSSSSADKSSSSSWSASKIRTIPPLPQVH